MRSRRHVEPLSTNTRTLAQHYVEKLRRQEAWRNDAADGLMLRVFAPPDGNRARRRGRPRSCAPRGAQLVDSVARTSGTDRYTLHQVLRIAIHRCDELDLRLRGGAQRVDCRMCAGCWVAWCGRWTGERGPS